MNKVKLKIEALAVQTFATSGRLDGRGTVLANSPGTVSFAAPEGTCGISCLDPNSCVGTCFCSAAPPGAGTC